jgi:hypothetical protein
MESTYFVQDWQNEDELRRLTIQDHKITSLVGGVLPERSIFLSYLALICYGTMEKKGRMVCTMHW